MRKILLLMAVALGIFSGKLAANDCGLPDYTNRAYNVYGDEKGLQVVYSNKIYAVKNDYIPVNCHPESAWSYLWEYVGPCGESGTGSGSGSASGSVAIDYDHNQVSCLRKHLMIGYWHNFMNGTSNGLKLRDVSQHYDMINVSFAETDTQDLATLVFSPDGAIYATDQAFVDDVRYLQSKGKKVNLSLGGANGRISITNESDKVKFVNSIIAIVEKYGFDGIDIDFEGTSAGGQSQSFMTPNASAQLTIDAIREVCEHFGKDFILSMAPETAYVQFGYNAAASPAYLSLIYALRDILTVLHVQLYNSGSTLDLNNHTQIQGSMDFVVSMCEMVLQGFPNAGTTFPALDESQVAIGVPSCPGAGAGELSPVDVKKALQYLITGVKPEGISYTLKNPNGYPNFRGVMTWSVNWDATTNYALASAISSYYSEIGNPVMNCGEDADTQAPTSPTNLQAVAAEKSVKLTWTASTDNDAVKGYNIYVGTTKVGTSTSCTFDVNNLKAQTNYTFYVEAYDATGNKSDKASVAATTLESTEQTTPPTEGEGGDYGECTEPEWDASLNYQTPGEKVSYNGKIYKVKNNVWWTTAGSAPDTNTAQWDYVSNCDGTGGVTPPSTPTVDPVDTGIDYENGKRFVIYFPNWGVYNSAHLNITVSMIPWDKVTHINHAFFQVSDSYTLETTDSNTDYDANYEHGEGWEGDAMRGHMAEYKYFKQYYPNVKVLVSVGGWTKGHNFHAMALTKENRTIFINSVIAFLKQHPFIDGIDIDWEYPGVNRVADFGDASDKGCPGGPEDAANYVSLLKEIREAYAANDMTEKLLTVAASINQNVIAQGADPSQYAQYLDYINLMSYDLHGAFERVTNHHAAIYPNPNDPSATELERNTFNASAAAAFFVAHGFEKSKIVVGSPWYSRGWGGVQAGSAGDGLFQTATGYERGTWDDPIASAPGGQYPWVDCKKLETTAGWTKYFDNDAKVPYLYNASEGVFLTYEDEQSLGYRCDMVNENGYGGIIVWEISGDDLKNGAPMSEIVYEKLLKNTETSPTDLTDLSATECSMVVYPVPASDELHVELQADAKLTLTDLFGKQVMVLQAKAGDNALSVAELPSGVYFVTARTADGISSAKVLKE